MIKTLVLALVFFTQPADPKIIGWGDLVPEGQAPAVPPIGLTDHEFGVQTGSAETVDELHEAYIRMPGFMLPLDYTERGRVRAFLLVPYYGACIHVPPPPPNQIVYVSTTDEPVESKGLWDPVWVTGTMYTTFNVNDLGNAAYTLRLDSIEPYEE